MTCPYGLAENIERHLLCLRHLRSRSSEYKRERTVFALKKLQNRFQVPLFVKIHTQVPTDPISLVSLVSLLAPLWARALPHLPERAPHSSTIVPTCLGSLGFHAFHQVSTACPESPPHSTRSSPLLLWPAHLMLPSDSAPRTPLRKKQCKCPRNDTYGSESVISWLWDLGRTTSCHQTSRYIHFCKAGTLSGSL